MPLPIRTADIRKAEFDQASIEQRASGRTTWRLSRYAEWIKRDIRTYKWLAGAIIALSPLASARCQSVSLTCVPASITYGNSITLTATAPTGGTGTMTFMLDGSTQLGQVAVSTSTSIAVLSTTSVHAGAHLLTVSYSGDSTFPSATSTAVSLSVAQATGTITWPNPASITYPTPFGVTQNATITGPYSPPVYSPKGTQVDDPGSKTETATFTPTSSDFAVASMTVPLTINKANLNFPYNWNPTPIIYGTGLGAQQLNAVVSNTIPGTIVYSQTPGEIEPVPQKTLNAKFVPADSSDYNSMPMTASLTINMATPQITWQPASIVAGTALTSQQLNATANIAGTFSYNPAAGTVITSANSSISVSFTPTEHTADYFSTSANVSLDVEPILFTCSLASGTASCAVTLPLDATGQISLSNDGIVWTTAGVSGGMETVGGDPLSSTVGIHQISVNYSGNYGSLGRTVTYEINGAAQPFQVGTEIYSYNIPSAGYDQAGNIIAYTDSVNGSWTNIQYDNLNRLTAATSQMGTAPVQYMCWNYDSFGNRLSQALQTTPCAPYNPAPPAYPAYMANNQLNPINLYQYDQAGNMTNDGKNGYTYDAEGRLCAVEYGGAFGTSIAITGYLYDAEGVRIAKTSIPYPTPGLVCDNTTNNYTIVSMDVMGPDGVKTATAAPPPPGSGTNLTASITNSYVHADGALVATIDSNQAVHFQLSDWLGTRRFQADANGNMESTFWNRPFGDTDQVYNSSDPTAEHFTGKERDAESGNDYFGARYYGSAGGRFSSPDTSVDQHASKPQSWNLYVYARNNPMLLIDPTGHYACGSSDNDKNCQEMDEVMKNIGTLVSRGVDPGEAEDYHGSDTDPNSQLGQDVSAAQNIVAAVSEAGGASSGDFNKDAFAKALDSNASRTVAGGSKSPTQSISECGKYVGWALAAAGLNIGSHNGGDYGPYLIKAGFDSMSTDNSPETADIAIFQSNKAHPYGHSTGYDGTQWVSDFMQRSVNPYRDRSSAGTLTYYRWNQ